MQCKDIMRRPVERVTVRETIQSVARRMKTANVGFIPVCDDRDQVVGVVTDRDIAVRACAEGASPAEVTAGDIMTRQAVTCRATDSVERVEQLMAEHSKSRIVVTGEHDELIGVISLSDIAATAQPGAAETLGNVARREVIRPNT